MTIRTKLPAPCRKPGAVDNPARTCYDPLSPARKEHTVKREYPVAPVIAVGAIICHQGRLVLIRRDKEPSKGRWTFPGGAVELGESLEDAVRREILEETGLQVDVGEVAMVLDHVVRDEAGEVRYHYIIVDYFARPVGGVLQPGSDVSDACWVGLDDLDGLEMTEKAGELARELLGEMVRPSSSLIPLTDSTRETVR
jgi:8-oxo-dGTP diphosphatase